MILDIVAALIIFYWGIPLLIFLLILVGKMIGAGLRLVKETIITVANAITDVMEWIIRGGVWIYRAVRAQVQNLG